MMRRRLAIYICMLAAGITAGFFVFERLRIVSGLIFLLSSVIAIVFCIPKEERISCVMLIVTGFILFANSYTCYESCPVPEDMIEGRVTRAEDKGDYIRLMIHERHTDRYLAVDMDEYEEGSFSKEYVPLIGAKVRIYGRAKEIRGADNPGCFDYKTYMRSLNISYAYKGERIEKTHDGREPIWRLRRYLMHARESYLDEFDEERSAFIKAVIFGDKSEIDDEIIEEFNINSSGHILAVSGLHIGFLYALLKRMMRGRKTYIASAVIISVLVIYGEMSMWSSSVIRAVIVLSMNLISVNINRDFDLLSSLAASAFVILIFRPYMLFNSGFQLSFAAIGGIAFLGRRFSAVFGEVIGSGLAVQVGTIPLIATIYRRVNLMSFLINIPIILLSSLLVPLCIFGMMLHMLTQHLPLIIVNSIKFTVDMLLSLNHGLTYGGRFSNYVAGIGPGIVVLFYISVIIASCEWTRVMLIRKKYRDISRLLLLLITPILSLQIALYNGFYSDELVFVAVGQGDCTHIRAGYTDIFIDGGGSDYMNVGERILMPYLLYQGASDVDMAFVTHLHSDHYKGIAELARKYQVDTAVIPADYKKDKGGSEINSRRILYMNGESEVKVNDELSIRSIWPLAGASGDIKADDPNEHNMVYMITYRGVKIMVTGDLLEDDERKMLRHYGGSDALKCDILKVAHHGSKTSSSEEFLDAASPKIAVIQAGRNNMYGHPHSVTLSKLEERGIEIYRCDTDGAVGIDIGKRDGRIRVHTMH